MFAFTMDFHRADPRAVVRAGSARSLEAARDG